MKLKWDQVGERLYYAGVDHGVLYKPDQNGAYINGVVWNGLTTVTESPEGAEVTPQYADNQKYLNLQSAEDFKATIECFTYPKEFDECCGIATPSTGVLISQQARKTFGFSYRTKIGNDVSGLDFGYQLHLVYGALAAPSEKANATVNDSPEAQQLSYEISTTPVEVSLLKPTAHVVVDSTRVDPTALAALEDLLYGTGGTTARLPLPDEVVALFVGTVQTVTPTKATYNGTTHTITIPTTTGVTYYRSDTGKPVTGTVVLSTGQNLTIQYRANSGYKLAAGVDDDDSFSY